MTLVLVRKLVELRVVVTLVEASTKTAALAGVVENPGSRGDEFAGSTTVWMTGDALTVTVMVDTGPQADSELESQLAAGQD